MRTDTDVIASVRLADGSVRCFGDCLETLREHSRRAEGARAAVKELFLEGSFSA